MRKRKGEKKEALRGRRIKIDEKKEKNERESDMDEESKTERARKNVQVEKE